MSLSTFKPSMLCNVMDYGAVFKGIVEICRRLAVRGKKETEDIVNTIVTVGGLLLGGLLGGFRGALAGGLAGSVASEQIRANDTIIDLGEYLLNELPHELKKKIVDFFQRFLAPFRAVADFVDRVVSSCQLSQKFMQLLKGFFDKFVPNVSILA